MIQVIKNQANTVVVTLKEKQTLTNPDFLFEFTHDITGQVKLFTAVDTSAYTDRFNSFTITDNTTELPYSGQMNFNEGYHSYKVYEMNNASPVDLDPDNAVTVLETGKVEVIDDSASTDVSFDEDDTINNVCFDEP